MKREIIFRVKRFTEHLKLVKINDFHFLNLVCIYIYMYIHELPELRVVNNLILNTVSRVCHSNSIYLLLENHSYRSEEHTSELQSHVRISYAVFCLKKKKKNMI